MMAETPSNAHPRDIALALSGGGYRASYFHLGVLRKLHDLGLLERVGVVSGVSGGSILAGLYATSLLHGESFADFMKRARRLLDRRVALDWPAMLHDALPWSRSSRRMVRAFESQLSRAGKPILMRDLAQLSPRFVINATAVHSGAGWRFVSTGVAEHWDLGFTHSRTFDTRCITYECDVSLGAAVAASAAFPTFSAVSFPREAFREVAKQESIEPVARIVAPLTRKLPPHVVLSDGGVVDNTGATSVFAGQTPPDAPDFYMIVSDAGSEVQRLNSPPRGRVRKLSYLMRQFEMRGSHNNQMTAFLTLSHYRSQPQLAAKGFAIFRINRAVPHAGETLEQAEALARIPTRLCRMPAEQSRALMEHAGNLVWTRLTEYTDLLPEEAAMQGATRQKSSDA